MVIQDNEFKPLSTKKRSSLLLPLQQNLPAIMLKIILIMWLFWYWIQKQEKSWPM